MAEYSKIMEKYFQRFRSDITKAYKIAENAKKKNLDPNDFVEVPMVENMAERVEGLISVVAPQVRNSGISKRIKQLEEKYGSLNWRVALTIGLEVAQQKYCKFDDQKQAIEIGIRTGFAYLTMGIVASPLEGFVDLTIKKRKDGKEYFSLNYAGPIRSAGGTGASVSVILADYIRKNFGYSEYDPTEEEAKRFVTELYDYHDRITNLQYLPSEEEIEFLGKHLPVQIDGDGSEKIEVSNYKDLDRVETNRIRNGVCLVMGEGIAQKSEKLWKQLSKWGTDFGLEHWNWLREFNHLKDKMHAKGDDGSNDEEKPKVLPNYTFIKDLVGGRPVYTHPMRHGGFRLRYGRSRTSGYSSYSIHPSTMFIMDDFLAIGTQLKNERPGKGCTVTVCDSIEGPIVRLKDGSLKMLNDPEEAKRLSKEVEKIMFLGDILINYGDFNDRNHILVPPGYCEEWWIQELEKAAVDSFGTLDYDKISDATEIPIERIEELMKDHFFNIPTGEEAYILSEKIGVPLHPRYTYHWKGISTDEFKMFYSYLKKATNTEGKLVIKNDEKIKHIMDKVGLLHLISNNEFIVIDKDHSYSISKLDGEPVGEDALQMFQSISHIKIRDKSGIFIGARMGRPEKGKMRSLQGSPQVLFPVGEEGGRLRSFQSALQQKKVTGDFPIYYCKRCEKETIYRLCEDCSKKTVKLYHCHTCPKLSPEDKCEHGDKFAYKRKEIDINHYFNVALKHLGMRHYPDLIKGVRGTMNKTHEPENLAKGILRAKHHIYVNKDGTTRFDMTQMPITHFKPVEIHTSVEKLKELGYEKDINGKELVDDEQVLELRPQDIILPKNVNAVEDGAHIVLKRVTDFLDDLLVTFYKLDPYYKIKDYEDLAGHMVLVLAPHTSGGIAGRIIGFSDSQVLFASPLLHAATRRDCLTYDTMISVFDKIEKKWSNVEIGNLVEELKPDICVDKYGTLVKRIDRYKTYSYGKKGMEFVDIKEFSEHKESQIIEIEVEGKRKIKTTLDHQIFTKGFVKKRADNLRIGDQLILPYKLEVKECNTSEIDLFDFLDNKDIMGRKLENQVIDIVKENGGRKKTRELWGLSKNDLDNYLLRDSYPLVLLKKLDIRPKYLSYKRDTIKIPAKIPINDDTLYLFGLYIAEGFTRFKEKEFYQLSIAATELEIRQKIMKIMKRYFNLLPSENHIDHITYSSRILHDIVTKLGLGKSAKTKRIPSMFMDLPKENIASLLRGYFDGDGSVSKGDLRVMCDSVSDKLLYDINFVLKRFGISSYLQKYEKEPGPIVKDFYIKKKRKIPKFKNTKLVIPSKFSKIFYEKIGFGLSRKQNILQDNVKNIKYKYNRIESDSKYSYPKVTAIRKLGLEKTYCLNLKNHNFIADEFLVKNCDGDEACVVMLLDVLINFSRLYLPSSRGSTQDAPLVLTWKLTPAEVDDMVFNMDIAWKYPLEFYNACLEYKKPWEVDIDTVDDFLGKERQYEEWGFTHPIKNINKGVLVSSYKTLPSMKDKILGQMGIAEKIQAVDEGDVARLVIEKHFLKDIKGNLRKFSMQQFRCVACNEKFRRPPLNGKCSKCGGKIIFTISEGSIVKYLQPSMDLAKNYHIPVYLQQTLDILQRRVEGMFGREKEKQSGLGEWF